MQRESSLKEDLKSLDLEYESMQVKIKESESYITRLEESKKTLEYDVSKLQSTITTLYQTRDEQDVLIGQQSDKIEQFDGRIRVLTGEYNRMNDDKYSLKSSVLELTGQESLLRSKIERLSGEYESRTAQLEKELAELDNKVKNSQQKLIDINRQEEIIRGDLATRQMRLDEQDKNLRIREMKVQSAENQIRANANLLDL